jgi:hypothetical protein
MIRKMKALGLTAAAALCLTAVGASVAQASAFHTKESKYPAAITGVQQGTQTIKVHVETGSSGEIKCNTVSLTGTLAAQSSTLTVHPTYGECTAFGAAAVINTANCNYVFHTGAMTAMDQYTGTMDIECSAGGSISIVSTACEIRIPPQNGLTGLKFVDLTPEGAVSTEFQIGTFSYSVTKDGLGCPLTGLENRIDGSFKAPSAARLTAKVGGVPVALTVQ